MCFRTPAQSGDACCVFQMEQDQTAHRDELRKALQCKDQVIEELKQTNVKLQTHFSQPPSSRVQVRRNEFPVLPTFFSGQECPRRGGGGGEPDTLELIDRTAQTDHCPASES